MHTTTLQHFVTDYLFLLGLFAVTAYLWMQ